MLYYYLKPWTSRTYCSLTSWTPLHKRQWWTPSISCGFSELLTTSGSWQSRAGIWQSSLLILLSPKWLSQPTDWVVSTRYWLSSQCSLYLASSLSQRTEFKRQRLQGRSFWCQKVTIWPISTYMSNGRSTTTQLLGQLTTSSSQSLCRKWARSELNWSKSLRLLVSLSVPATTTMTLYVKQCVRGTLSMRLRSRETGTTSILGQDCLVSCIQAVPCSP